MDDTLPRTSRIAFWSSWWRVERWLGRTRLMRRLVDAGEAGRLYWVPSLPRFLTARFGTEPHLGPKSLAIPEVPAPLRSEPGVHRDPELERRSFARGPVPRIDQWFPAADELTRRYMWMPLLMSRPRIARVRRAFYPNGVGPRSTPNPRLSPEELSAKVKARAAELGLSAIGITAYDEKYVWATDSEKRVGGTMIVCALEQNYRATQTAPSVRSERSALAAYGPLYQRTSMLATYLRELGYTAREAAGAELGPVINYAVESGLGQLGLNGQLLTPFAGSRCRLTMLNTDAPLAMDRPVDYGVPKLCDECRVCVRRCPTGAIPSVRRMHRGVEKAKIKIERCAPIVAQAHGCAICMKTCPVQKYGLPKVLDHYAATGEVLGKGTDELEGYLWPDGRWYPAGKKPRSAVTKDMLEPDGVRPEPTTPFPA